MRSILPRSSSAKKERIVGDGSSDNDDNRTHIYLNVYDLTPINDYLCLFGLGIFHSGIEVHGMEYGFGAHDYPSSGVFEVEPKSCPGFIYRRSVWLGTTDMSRTEFSLFLSHLSQKYHGDTYHLLAKNCNHFTDDVCMLLTGKPIPRWVNRIARLVSGSFCNCLLPGSLQITAVRHSPDYLYPNGSGLLTASVIEDTDDEQLDHHLLTPYHVSESPVSEPAHSREKPLRLAKDIPWFSD